MAPGLLSIQQTILIGMIILLEQLLHFLQSVIMYHLQELTIMLLPCRIRVALNLLW